jgi:nitrate reductase NapE component
MCERDGEQKSEDEQGGIHIFMFIVICMPDCVSVAFGAGFRYKIQLRLIRDPQIFPSYDAFLDRSLVP